VSAAEKDDIPPEIKYRCIDYGFTADCTLHLEDGTDVRRKVRGKWYSSNRLNDAEWRSDAEACLAWIVGTLHRHASDVPARVEHWIVHSWRKQ
jgi:hypothetical protein